MEFFFGIGYLFYLLATQLLPFVLIVMAVVVMLVVAILFVGALILGAVAIFLILFLKKKPTPPIVD